MSPGPKMPLAPARRLAEALVRELEPACERIEIAGSIRRGADHVGDLELLAIPRLEDRVAPGQTSLLVLPPTTADLRGGRMTWPFPIPQPRKRSKARRPGLAHRWRAAWRVRARHALDSALSGLLSVPSRFTQSTDFKGPRVRAGLALARTR